MSVLCKRGVHSLDDEDVNDIDGLSELAPKSKKQKVSHSNSNNKNIIEQDEESGLDANPFPNDKINEEIILNVGGIKYSTTIQTITGYKSMLKARFSSLYAIKPSSDGTYFIDRDGELFKYILEYFRSGHLILSTTWNTHDIWRFYIEVKYFMIESLFDTVLLKLFDSKIMKNNAIKLQIMNKMSDTLKLNKLQIMESLNEWELFHEYNALNLTTMPSDSEIILAQITNLSKFYLTIHHSLLLLQVQNGIYGLFLTMHKTESSNKWFYIFSKSFAFDCGPNSSHISSTRKIQDINVEFRKIRKTTEEEEANIDTDVYHTFIKLYPMIVQYYKSGYIFAGSFDLKWFVQDKDKDFSDFERVSRMELWSIPLF